MGRRRRRAATTIAIAGAALATPLWLSAGRPTAAPAAASVRVEASAPQMGTLARIVVYAPDRAIGEAAAAAAFARIAEIDARLSDYRDDSELARLSGVAAGTPTTVSGDLFAVLAASHALAARSGGAFDITAGRLTHLWRRARRLNAWPGPAQVDAARAAGGYGKVRLDAARRAVTLEAAGIELDAGGIGKGYAADEALRALRGRGLAAALVAIAGDVAAGDPPPGEPAWRVAIPRLGDADAEPFWIPLVGAAVSTSGDAEQWMTVDGVRRSHVIDLRTGWPIAGRSATSVIAARGIDADALSTAVAILGREAGEALLRDARPVPARGLWQRLREDGTLELHRTTTWPVPPRS